MVQSPIDKLSYANFRFNPQAKIMVKWIGRENHPVMIIDRAFASPDRIREHAINCLNKYLDALGKKQLSLIDKSLYPGVQYPVTKNYALSVIKGLENLLLSVDTQEFSHQFRGGSFSLATLKPEELAFRQTIPHVDTYSTHNIAILHFLSLPEMCWGGTGFYRHKKTGFESLSKERLSKYDLAQVSYSHQYITDSHDDFDLVDLIPMRYNRLIIYAGNILHSGYINPSLLSHDPVQGRLTGNLFIRLKQPFSLSFVKA